MPRQQLIKIRKGSSAPAAADFQEGEPAWDSTNKKLYVKAADGTMAEIGRPFGYTSNGGTVTQQTSKSTGVTLNAACGEITMNGAQLTSGSTVTFTLTNSTIGAGDLLILNHVSVGTFGIYLLNARCSAGSAEIDVANRSSNNRSEAIVIRFAVVKAVTA